MCVSISGHAQIRVIRVGTHGDQKKRTGSCGIGVTSNYEPLDTGASI